MNNKYAIQNLELSSDEQLVAHIQARGTQAGAAYNVLIHRHQKDLLRRCRAHLGNTADAEDAVQETLLRAYRGLLAFKGESCFRTWLFAIANNQCNTLHVRRSRKMLSDHVRALIEIDQEMRSRTELADDEGRLELVRGVLEELPGQVRDVLMLRFHLELSLEEIAMTLEIGLSAAKMRLYRAIGEFESQFLVAWAKVV